MKALSVKSPKSTLILVLTCTLLSIFGCQEKEDLKSVEPIALRQTNALRQTIEKIETAYKEGDLKQENLGPEKGFELETGASIDVQNAVKARLLEYQRGFDSRYLDNPTVSPGYKVGVIPAVDACPAGMERINFFMDNQDNGNTNKTGWTGNWYVNQNGNSSHTICSVNSLAFKFMTLSSPTKYLVIRLGNDKTSVMEPRVWNVYFDNEDKGNLNSVTGNFGPNSSTPNGTNLQFWAIAGQNTPGVNQDAEFPDFGFSYGVFGTFTSPVVGGLAGQGTFHTDDENSNNANQLYSVDWVTNIATDATHVEGYGVDRTNDPGNTTFNIRRVR